jgi:hypothetical protein
MNAPTLLQSICLTLAAIELACHLGVRDSESRGDNMLFVSTIHHFACVVFSPLQALRTSSRRKKVFAIKLLDTGKEGVEIRSSQFRPDHSMASRC